MSSPFLEKILIILLAVHPMILILFSVSTPLFFFPDQQTSSPCNVEEKRRKTKELKALQMVQRKDFWGPGT